MRSVPVYHESAYLLWQEQGGGYAPLALSKWRIFTLLSLFMVFFLTSLSLGAYLYFKEDVLAALMRRSHEQTVYYEDRIAKMRVQMDRVASRQLIDQELFEKKVESLLDKQAVMEERQARLASLGGIAAPALAPQPARLMKPTPLTSSGGGVFASLFGKASASRSLGENVEHITQALHGLEVSQMTFVTSSVANLTQKNQEMTRFMREFGVNTTLPQGGPFVSPRETHALTPFDKSYETMQREKEKYRFFWRNLQGLPLARPLPVSHEITSSFGTRTDPFRGTAALHAGIDFRGNTGDFVRATGAGKVVTAAAQGGYGNMVEIEHHHGLTTRYAHLSQFEVREGENVQAGQIIGRVGSTGRSTGPHLHYEVRKDEEAIDPSRYLNAAARVEAFK